MVATPYDEKNIQANDVIIRRISLKEHVVRDDNKNCCRISSKAYQVSSGVAGGMSVDIESLIIKDKKDPKKFVTAPPFTGSVSFLAKQIRAIGLWVGYDPIQNNPQGSSNPYHGQVWQKKSAQSRSSHFTRGQQKQLRNAAQWYVSINGVETK
ncbi:MAG: hypothetical protein ACR2PR_04215 [Pseudohongiellaceae bacterium]